MGKAESRNGLFFYPPELGSERFGVHGTPFISWWLERSKDPAGLWVWQEGREARRSSQNGQMRSLGWGQGDALCLPPLQALKNL